VVHLLFQDKPALFRNFFKWLKPGGKVLISDYCRNAGEPSEDFAAYIKQRGYDLHDVKTYGKVRFSEILHINQSCHFGRFYFKYANHRNLFAHQTRCLRMPVSTMSSLKTAPTRLSSPLSESTVDVKQFLFIFIYVAWTNVMFLQRLT
jgi:hypothetical protein